MTMDTVITTTRPRDMVRELAETRRRLKATRTNLARTSEDLERARLEALYPWRAP